MPKRAPQLGDVFEVRGAHAGLAGRVVSTSAIVGPTHGCMLVYIYSDASRPSRDALLVAPMMTTRAPWSRGYFVYARSEPLLPGQYFEKHSFRDARGVLYDEEARPLEEKIEPVGEWKLWEVEAIEEAIRGALGGPTPVARGSARGESRQGAKTPRRK